MKYHQIFAYPQGNINASQLQIQIITKYITPNTCKHDKK